MSQEVSTYNEAVKAIKTAILQGQYEAAKGVNRIQLAIYFGIGRYLSQHTRKGVWGTGALNVISKQLQKELPGLRGYSAESLKLMRRFYEGWIMLDADSSVVVDKSDNRNSVIPITESQAIDEHVNTNTVITITQLQDFPAEDFFRVPFTHHIRIVDYTKDLAERYYYINRTAEEHLSVEALKRIMLEDAFHHQAALPNNFTQTMSNAAQARKAVMMFKDEYLLNFINVEEIGERDAEDVDERVVEQQIVHNVKNFIMAFGRDFTFVGNQYHLEKFGHDLYPDLLFYNRELACLVAVELKKGDFKPAYLGQLSAYLRVLDAEVKKPFENPSIGIVLCRNADKSFVEFLVQGYDNPMGVATYKTREEVMKVLPSEKELLKLLEGE